MGIFAGNKKILLIIFAVLLTGMLFSCVTPDQSATTDILSLEVLNPDDAKFKLGEVDLSVIQIKVNKANGSSEIVSLDETMISDLDRTKLRSAGTNTLIITYRKKKVVLSVTVSEAIVQQTYNVFFETNSEDSVIPPQYNITKIEKLTNPTKTGYTFLGWYDNADLRGSRIVAPYTLGQDMTLYAKWEDNRKYTVQFLDYYGEVINAWTQTVVHGGNIAYIPEQAPTVEGYRFVEWRGQKESITSNVTLTAEYARIMYTVTYYHFYNTNEEQTVSISVGHGDAVPMDRRQTVNMIEGYDAKWQVRYENGTVEDLDMQLEEVKSNLDIIPHYTIKRFRVFFSDDEQFHSSMDTWNTFNREVDYGGSIMLTESQSVPLPQSRTGHDATWAVETKINVTDSAFLWRNVNKDNSYVWRNDIFEWEMPLGAESSVYNVYDHSGAVIAVIDNGNITQIKADLHIEAKYVKKKYRLVFNFKDGSPYIEENVKYGTQYSLYDIVDKREGVMYGRESKSFFTQYPVLADWDVKWYPNTSYNESEKIIFDDGGVITVDVAQNNIHYFYSRQIDLRRYRLKFYDWDFVHNSPVQKYIKADTNGDGVLEDVGEVFLPLNTEIKNYFPTMDSKVSFGYDFIDNINFWYDTPQGTPYGQVYTQNTRIDRDLELHARYVKRKFTITFRDYEYPYTEANKDYFSLLQIPPTVYDITDSNGDIVSQYVIMVASFTREYGYQFNVDELYFGGDEIYQKKLFIDNYEADGPKHATLTANMPTANEAKLHVMNNYPLLYRLLITNYDDVDGIITVTEHEDNYPAELADTKKVLDIITAAKNKATFLLDQVSSYYNNRTTYNVTVADAALFKALMSEGVSYLTYNQIRLAEYQAQSEIDFCTEYMGARKTVRDGYLAEFQNNLIPNPGDYSALKYNVAMGTRGSYEFKGWHLNANFTSDSYVDSESGVLVTEAPALKNGLTNIVTLYAKWVDSETGSEGLVFALKSESNPAYTQGGTEPEFFYYYEVIDYIHKDVLTSSGYSVATRDADNNPETYTYTNGDITITDIRMNNLPTSAQGMDRSVKIPAGHNGLPVRAISAKIFESGSYSYISETILFGLTSVEIERNVQWIGEGAFALVERGFLEIVVSEENDYFASIGGVLYGIEKTGDSRILRTLISYPNSLSRADSIESDITLKADTYVVPASVTRIAEKAFTGAQLKEIAIEGGSERLTIASNAFYACNEYLERVGELIEEGGYYRASTVLPDRVYEIGSGAFRNLVNLTQISAGETSELRKVGENAFEGSGWMLNIQNSTATHIMLGKVLIGLNKAIDGNTLLLEPDIVSIADGALRGSTKVKTLKITSDSVQYIGKYAFAGSWLEYVEISNPDPAFCEVAEGAFDSLGISFRIVVPHEGYNNYCFADGWKEYASSIYPAT